MIVVVPVHLSRILNPIETADLHRGEALAVVGGTVEHLLVDRYD